MQEGLSERQLLAIDDYARSDHFSMRQKLALEYADRITLTARDVDETFFEALRTEFPTPEEIVELTAIVAFENCRSKFNHALRIESNGICPVKLATESGCRDAR